MRAAATILLACLIAVLGGAEARAATVSVTGASLRVTAAPGELNRVAIAPVTGALAVTDTGAPLQAGEGCAVAGAAVQCASLALLDVTVELGDGNDTLTSTAVLPLVVTDGVGNDTLTGGPAADTFHASPGADSYAGGGGNDAVSYADREDAVAAAYPMKRLGVPEDIAGAVSFLLSRDASWITGQTLTIDGGVTLGGAL